MPGHTDGFFGKGTPPSIRERILGKIERIQIDDYKGTTPIWCIPKHIAYT